MDSGLLFLGGLEPRPSFTDLILVYHFINTLFTLYLQQWCVCVCVAPYNVNAKLSAIIKMIQTIEYVLKRDRWRKNKKNKKTKTNAKSDAAADKQYVVLSQYSVRSPAHSLSHRHGWVGG